MLGRGGIGDLSGVYRLFDCIGSVGVSGGEFGSGSGGAKYNMQLIPTNESTTAEYCTKC